MDKNRTPYVIGFALCICVVCSLLLSFISQSLKDRQAANERTDVKRNILKAVKLKDPLAKNATNQQIESVFESKIKAIRVDREGNVIPGTESLSGKKEQKGLPMFIYEENGSPRAYCFPIQGKGLWSILYGYLALEPDAITVRGITFYKDGETPGLGAEIEKDWFQNNFVGKKIWDAKEQKLRPIVLVKGKVKDKIPKGERAYYVDGISGATLTSNGVTNLLAKWLKVYEPYFAKIRK